MQGTGSLPGPLPDRSAAAVGVQLCAERGGAQEMLRVHAAVVVLL